MPEQNNKRIGIGWRIVVLFIGLGYLFIFNDILVVESLKHQALGFQSYVTAAEALLGINFVFVLLMLFLPVNVSSGYKIIRIVTRPSGLTRILLVFLLGILTFICCMIILNMAPIGRVLLSKCPDRETVRQIEEEAPCKIFWSSEGFFYPSGKENEDAMRSLFEKHGLDFVKK